jgi:hypothetical protein
VIVGDYAADLLVQDRVLIELKAVRALDNIHFAQCLNYLKATGLRICLLMDFGRPRLQVRRIRNDWERLEPQMNTDSKAARTAPFHFALGLNEIGAAGWFWFKRICTSTLLRIYREPRTWPAGLRWGCCTGYCGWC